MQNKNRFLKIKFEKPSEQLKFNNKIVHILFYSNKNVLLSQGFEKQTNLLSFLRDNIVNNTINIINITSEKGIFLLVKTLTKDDKNYCNSYLEELGGNIYKSIKSIGVTKANIYENDVYFNSRVSLGILLSSYKFLNYKKNKIKDNSPLKSLVFKCSKINENIKSYNQILNIAKGVFTARDLVWQPPNILYPETFCKECIKLKDIGVEVKVYNETQLKKIGMNALLAVGRGSRKESRVVVMQWLGGRRGSSPMAFIGKGVCFDSGGLSLKPPKSMEDMKWDMGGAATVTGLMETVALSKVKCNVIGVLGLVENMPDGDAQRPGDVVVSYSGQTIEVLNTDAEGRLVLGDILNWTEKKFSPQFMVDLATLTGAMIVALGNIRAGMFSNNNKISNAIFKAGEISGEKVWEMPLDDEYNQLLKTEIADMKNIGGPGAGSITAACFLSRHVEKTPWAHLDIAGVTWKNKSSPTIPFGGVGWGVKMLYQLINDNIDVEME